MTSGPSWSAYCAPGRKAWSAIFLALKGQEVTSITETRAIKGDDIYLINDAAIGEALTLPADFKFEFPSAICDRSPLNPLRMLAEDMRNEQLLKPVLSPIVTLSGC